ncbi:MAG TPA: ABC transporter permease [Candidatus Dormibacteraeota bacterium]|jgi:osmoprotectant transport system permease protein|nr:ABC transporter permease [Candidatus Dormibacteraeota bacterium]
MPPGLFLAYDPWINWDWLSTHIPLFTRMLTAHIELTVIAVTVGFVIALPVGVLAQRVIPLRGPILTIDGIFYTIPSIALFSLLIPYTGLTTLTAEIGLVSYVLLILTRNVVVGLDAVPRDVIDAADGMGYRPFARLIRVELPLALPTIFAGIRIATVTTIGLITITAVIGQDSLGQLILQGLTDNFHTPLVVGTVLSVLLAFVADVGLALSQRIAVPWSRSA